MKSRALKSAALCAAIVLLVCIAASISWADASSQYADGRAHYQAGEYQDALASFSELLTSNPASAESQEANYWIGLCYEQLGRTEAAIVSFQAQISQFPSNHKSSAAMVRVGQYLVDNGQYVQAMALYNQALTRYPDKALDIYYRISECYRAQSKTTEAIAALKHGVASVGDTASVDQIALRYSLCSLAECYRSMADLDGALAAYLDLAQTFPDETAYKYDLAQCYMERNEFDSAIAILNQITDSRESLRAQYLLGECYRAEGKNAEAITALKNALASVVDKASADRDALRNAMCSLADLYSTIGQSSDAIAAYKDLVDTFRQEISFKYALARCYFDAKDYENALATYSQISDPNSALEAGYGVSECYRAQGKYAEAIAELEGLLDAITNKASVDQLCLRNAMISLADCYRAVKDWDSAIAAYNDLITAIPSESKDCRYGIAECQTEKTQYPTAIAIYQELAQISAADALRSWFYIGWCYQVQRRFSEAISAYKTAVASAPADTSKDDFCLKYAKIHIAECYKDLGNLDASIAAYLEASQDCPEEAVHYELDAADRYLDKGDYAKVAEICNDVIENHPESAERALVLLGQCLKAQGQSKAATDKFNEAIACLQEAIAANPEMAGETLIRLAEVYSDYLGDCPKAITELTRISTDYPDSPKGMEAKALAAELTLFRLNDIPGARTMLQNITLEHANFESMAWIACNLATCSYVEGDYATAAELFSQATNTKDSGNYRQFSAYLAGDCYRRIGDTVKAKDVWNKLIELYPYDVWSSLATAQVQYLSEE